MKQLATVHVPASTAKDLNLEYREHPEDLNLGPLNYKSSNCRPLRPTAWSLNLLNLPCLQVNIFV